MSEASSEINELDSVLTTIESIDPDLAVKVTMFITDHLYDPEEPETWKLSLQYAKWAMSKNKTARRDDITHDCKVCWKNTKWIPEPDGSWRPCDKCSPDRVTQWQAEFVDSNEPPR